MYIIAVFLPLSYLFFYHDNKPPILCSVRKHQEKSRREKKGKITEEKAERKGRALN